MADEFRVVRGVPTDEELAAIVGVLLARRSAPAPQAEPPVSRWARSARPGASSGRGPSAWRASALPAR